jgi:hypothetical protein
MIFPLVAGFWTAEPCEQDANKRKVCLRTEVTTYVQLWGELITPRFSIIERNLSAVY